MLAAHVQLSPEALFQEIGGEGVILDLVSSTYFGLDEVGVRFWQLLQDTSDFRAAFATLLSEYDVEPGRLETDLDELVKQLVNAGLASID